MYMINMTQDYTVYKDGGWRGAFKVHFPLESKIGIIATLGIVSYFAAYAYFHIPK